MKRKKNDNDQKRYVPILSTVIEIIIGIVALFISIIPTFYKELDSLSAISIVGACLMFSVTISSIFSDYKIRKSIDAKLSENSQLFTEKLRVIEDVVSIDEIYKHIYEVQNTYGREFYTKKVKTFMDELSDHVIDLYSGILERNAYYSYLHHLADDAIDSKTAECWALTSFQETEWDRQDPLELKWQIKLKELNSTIKVKRVCVFSAKQQEMIKRSDILDDGGEHQYFLEQLHWYILNNKDIETFVVEGIGAQLNNCVNEGFFAITFPDGSKKLVRDRNLNEISESVCKNTTISGEIDFSTDRIEQIYLAWKELITCGAMKLDEYIDTYSSGEVRSILSSTD